MEACEFRDAISDFQDLDAVILGISGDTVQAQAKFKRKYNLPFALLCDTEHRAAEACGAWVEKNMYGKKSMGIARTTLLIGKDGRVRNIFRNVRAAGHAEQVKQALAALA